MDERTDGQGDIYTSIARVIKKRCTKYIISTFRTKQQEEITYL